MFASGKPRRSQPCTCAWACGWEETVVSLLERGPLAGGEHEGDLHGLLGDDGDRIGYGEHVEGAGDSTLDGVLDRRHQSVDIPREQVGGGRGATAAFSSGSAERNSSGVSARPAGAPGG